MSFEQPSGVVWVPSGVRFLVALGDTVRRKVTLEAAQPNADALASQQPISKTIAAVSELAQVLRVPSATPDVTTGIQSSPVSPTSLHESDTQTAPREVRYINSVDHISDISPQDRELQRKVSERYVFRANDYYLKLINWADPTDPIKQLIIPRAEELNDWGKLDASNEAGVTVAPGVQHKYKDTVLLLCNEVCGAYCRYCFRKRLFMNDNEDVSKDISAGLAYIRLHPEVSNVLLTGGDPLIMGTRRLTEIISALREIDHVKIIRIGSKMPAFNPFRVLDDPELQRLFRTYSTADRRIYLMCHFDHPRELTVEARAGIATLIECGVTCTNQCPMIRGINDHPDVLAEMFRELSYIGAPQYYVFQGRPTAGNEPFAIPIVRAWQIFSEALVRESGLAGRARFAMSHASGKIEIQAVDHEHIYLRYHRSKYPENNGKFFVCRRDDNAYWLEHLELAPGSYVPTLATHQTASPIILNLQARGICGGTTFDSA